MTTDTERPASARADRDSAAIAMLRGALVPTIVTSALTTVGAGLVVGVDGVWGALVGAGLVIAFFSASLLVLDRVRRQDPAIVLVVAMGLYAAKVIVLAIALVVLNAADVLGDPLHRGALAIAIILGTLTWTTAQIRASLRRREPVFDVEGGAAT